MLCENCGQREATIHEVLIDLTGSKVEKHLCERCAGVGEQGEPTQVPVSPLIGKFVVGPGIQSPGEPTKAAACPGCQRTWAKFRKHGLLGCPACYEAFEEKLGPLLGRAHEGGTHHVGKAPKRSVEPQGEGGRLAHALSPQAENAERLTQLRKQLTMAVRTERYERAAELKAEIERLTRQIDAGDSGNGEAADD